MNESEQPYRRITDLAAGYRLDAAGRRAVETAYDVFRRHHAPFFVSVAAQMLPDLRADAAQGRRVAFLGRDGHGYAIAAQALDPVFFSRSCHVVVLSRVVVEAALQDLEVNTGGSYSQIDGFRGARGRVDPADVTGSYRHLTRYLRQAGIPIGLPGSTVTLVDSSLKGTVQELLSAAYPATAFTGRYAFLSQLPGDPHPGSKHGYVMHRGPDEVPHGDLLMTLPDDPALTFASKEAISVLEDTLHGPLDTPRRIIATGPHQIGQRDDPDTLGGFNPIMVDPAFSDPVIREAVKAAGLLAVHDAAVDAAARRDAGQPWTRDLLASQQRFTDQVRAWVGTGTTSDPDLNRVLDSFVRRADNPLVRQLAATLQQAQMPPEPAEQVWRRFAAAGSFEAKRALLEAGPLPAPPPQHQVRQAFPTPPGPGRATPPPTSPPPPPGPGSAPRRGR
ncbi:hypothetical protein ACFFX1_10480 [Dactylosporangium sucinum]|uniref:Uncharacterized protein n=1 Tax=Dactylosporangium sucinum TaxID=1424081 RepID=A0A917THD4_9ACTN|nr:ABC transporter permease [Dactylosporangium sucinum]GGM23545.1 hypothetical protein GCM10007977_025930 [Dactylosporangium sucinum]